MGFGQRFKEKLRQTTHLSKDMGAFKGTDNDRVPVMLKEADECASRLKSFKKKLTVQHEATDSLLRSISKTLSSDSPQLYDRHVQTGSAVPTTTNDPHTLRVSELMTISSRHEQQLRAEVYAPIDKWLAVYKDISAKSSTLENHRLEFDNARRLHNRVELDKVRQMQKNDAVEQTTLQSLDSHNAEADARRQTYTIYEAEMHAQLTALLQDAANMQVVFAHALRIEADLLATSVAHNAPSVSEEVLTQGAPLAVNAIQSGASSQPMQGLGMTQPSGAGPSIGIFPNRDHGVGGAPPQAAPQQTYQESYQTTTSSPAGATYTTAHAQQTSYAQGY